MLFILNQNVLWSSFGSYHIEKLTHENDWLVINKGYKSKTTL